MKVLDLDSIERRLQKRADRRSKKRQPKMRVSGKSVFLLRELSRRRPKRKNTP